MNTELKIDVKQTLNDYYAIEEGFTQHEIDCIVDAVKSLIPEGVILYLTDDVVMFGDRFYVKATAALKYGNQLIAAVGWAREPKEQKGMAEPQITGAASSYARKYALNGLFAIDDGVDADSQNDGQATPKAPNTPKVLTAAQRLEAAHKKSQVIIMEYKNCKDLAMLANVQEKYHSELKRFSEGYEDIFSQINAVGLQVLASFDQ